MGRRRRLGGVDARRDGGPPGLGSTPPPAGTARLAATAAGCAVFVLTALVLELAAGAGANSAAPGWVGRVVPLTWPQGARVAWWLLVAAAALGFRASLHRLGFRQHPVVVVGSVAPFVIFAAGVAAGAGWSTWH